MKLENIIKEIENQKEKITSNIRFLSMAEEVCPENKIFHWILVELENQNDFLYDLKIKIINLDTEERGENER